MYAQIAHSVLVRRVRVSLGRARIGVATALLLAVGTSLSCREASKAATSDPSPVTLRFGVATPKTPDAAIGIRAFVNSLFSESLVTTRADGRPMERLASSWTWSPDFLTLELKIRDDLKFHDGTPVDNNYIKDYLTQAFKNPSVSYKSVDADRRSSGQRRSHSTGTAGGPVPRGALEHDDLDSRSQESRHRARRLSPP